tara:strand:+ start:354 stop:524 length:171 start_codon:yes stop_codon:yes gene_type:complete
VSPTAGMQHRIEGRERLPETNFFKICAHKQIFQESFWASADGGALTNGGSSRQCFL